MNSILPPSLPSILSTNNPYLILDLRPPTIYSHPLSKRLNPHSHNLPLPSTLLRRSTYPLSKVLENLPPRVAKTFWEGVIVIDERGEKNVCEGLLNKFIVTEENNWGNKFYYVQGGWNALNSLIEGMNSQGLQPQGNWIRLVNDLIEDSEMTEDEVEEDDDQVSASEGSMDIEPSENLSSNISPLQSLLNSHSLLNSPPQQSPVPRPPSNLRRSSSSASSSTSRTKKARTRGLIESHSPKLKNAKGLGVGRAGIKEKDREKLTGPSSVSLESGGSSSNDSGSLKGVNCLLSNSSKSNVNSYSNSQINTTNNSMTSLISNNSSSPSSSPSSSSKHLPPHPLSQRNQPFSSSSSPFPHTPPTFQPAHAQTSPSSPLHFHHSRPLPSPASIPLPPTPSSSSSQILTNFNLTRHTSSLSTSTLISASSAGESGSGSGSTLTPSRERGEMEGFHEAVTKFGGAGGGKSPLRWVVNGSTEEGEGYPFFVSKGGEDEKNLKKINVQPSSPSSVSPATSTSTSTIRPALMSPSISFSISNNSSPSSGSPFTVIMNPGNQTTAQQPTTLSPPPPRQSAPASTFTLSLPSRPLNGLKPPAGMPTTPQTGKMKNKFALSLAGHGAFKGLIGGGGARTAIGGELGGVKGFFDNIRQDNESLSLESLLEHLSPLPLPSPPEYIVPLLPPFLRLLLSLPPLQRMEKLAREFFELEKAEQERLRGVMEMHSEDFREEEERRGRGFKGSVGEMVEGVDRPTYGGSQAIGSGVGTGKVSSPGIGVVTEPIGVKGKEKWRKFGISAGVELGDKNRYKNIWPFEHSRVRLHTTPAPGTAGSFFPLGTATPFNGNGTGNGGTVSDYINASHINLPLLPPASTPYIATQGPMESTFSDFWSMVYTHNVGVIVMLTALREGGREKCGAYFREGTYGEFKVEVIEGPRDDQGEDNGFFAMGKEGKGTVDRKIRLGKRREDGEGWDERVVRHIQYLDWPDFDVPPEAGEVVKLVDHVEEQQKEYEMTSQGQKPPIVIHCSAGVGRTGSFIVIASVLELIKQQISSNPQNQPDTNPIPIIVEGIRQQRMSMVANLRQYASVYECVLKGVVDWLEERVRGTSVRR